MLNVEYESATTGEVVKAKYLLIEQVGNENG